MMKINDYRVLIQVFDEYIEHIKMVKTSSLEGLERNSLINLLTGVTMRRLNGRANPQVIREIFKCEIMDYC